MNKVDMLMKVPFFQELSPDELEPIAELLLERRYKKGATIFLEGDQGDELYIIKSGMVKIFRFDGVREVILALFREGDYFGEMEVIQRTEYGRSASAETLEPSVLYGLKRKDFVEFMEQKPQVALKLLDISMSRLRSTNEQLRNLTFLDARSRIIKTIIRLSQEHGVLTADGTLIDLKLTHQQLADMVSTVRETVTKVLLELQNKQLIHIDKKRILIQSPDQLKMLVVDE